MDIKEFKEIRTRLKKKLINMVYKAKKGHIPSSFSQLDFLVYLFYSKQFNFDPSQEERDKIIISKGHAAMALYPIITEFGYADESELDKFTTAEGMFRMYADHSIPMVESVTGSLGHGYGIGAGIAHAQKMSGDDSKVMVVLGDGENYEGSIWETAMFVSHYNLTNFVTIVDRNQLCILEKTENCIKLEPLHDKWSAFGFDVHRIDGHDFESIKSVVDKIKKPAKPLCIILDTVKGKGVSFMEGKHLWHNRMMDEEQLAQALKEVENE